MLTFLLLVVAVIVLGIIVSLFIGTGGILVILIFGDVIIGAFVVYKIIKLIAKKKK